jgi:hypothetical protein
MEQGKIRLRIYLSIFAAVMVMASAGFHYLEQLPILDAIYFSIVTVATVGYGDIHPVTAAGKILAILVIITGVGTFLSVIASATELFLSRREQEARRKKLNMIVGLFFTEAGTRLLRYLVEADPTIAQRRTHLIIKPSWTQREFADAGRKLASLPFTVQTSAVPLDELKAFLGQKADLLVGLMENPYTLEHESFTDLIISTLHLKEELESRESYAGLPAADYDHLAGDLTRVYGHLVRHWLSYMEHLKGAYPFLFSLAVRKNPFDPDASVVVRY